ncbi:hypothetical protein ACFL3D_00665 [Candidatus Omnitrophota bacterium]
MKKNINILLLVIFMFGSVLLTFTAYAAYQAEGNQLRLENWVLNSGAIEKMEGDLVFAMGQATIGQPVIGIAVSDPRIINEIPTYENKLWTGFLFVNWFESVSIDDQYDIIGLEAFRYEGGAEIEEATWINDPDPYFSWAYRKPDLPIDGFSYDFDILPDKFVDTVEPEYQTPDFYLSEGIHGFYVWAKNTAGSFGAVGAFEIWVDLRAPTITEILPADGGMSKLGQPTIQATVLDNLSGIDLASVDMKITTETETYQVLPNYDPNTGICSYEPIESLSDGLVTVFLSAKDIAGNESIPLFWTFTIDTQSPSGSIMINGGASSTESNKVMLTLSAEELETEIDAMMISNDGVFDDEIWEPFVPVKSNWFLDTVAGVKTVYVKFKDIAGNQSDVFNDSIVLTISSPNTYIVSAPPTITQTDIAKFVFMATEVGSSFYYRLDSAEWTGPITGNEIEYSGLAVGNHYFQVKAGLDMDSSGLIDADEIDITPAVVSWSIGNLSPATLYSERPVKYYRRE